MDRPAASGIRYMGLGVDLGADLAAGDNVAIDFHGALAKTASPPPPQTGTTLGDPPPHPPSVTLSETGRCPSQPTRVI